MPKKYTKEAFMADLIKEAAALRQNATPEEVKRLAVKELRPNNPSSCIYGQMTGNCRSDRAMQLIRKCCGRYFRTEDINTGSMFSPATTMNRLLSNANGKKVELERGRGGGALSYFSTVEAAIYMRKLRGPIIRYLKGKTDTLEIK